MNNFFSHTSTFCCNKTVKKLFMVCLVEQDDEIIELRNFTVDCGNTSVNYI